MIIGLGRRFRSVFENIHDPLLIVDLEGKILRANPAALEVLDTSEGRLPAVASLSERFVFDGEMVHGLVRRSETVTGHPLHEGGGDGDELVVDVITLGRRGGTAELKLVHLKDISRLSRRDRWKDELVSMVAHEVKNPLFAMKNSMSILLSQAPGATTPEQNKLLATSMRSIDRLTRLLDGLLEVSRVGSGNFLLERTWVSVREFIPEVVGSFESMFNVQQKTLACRISDETDRVYVDAPKLEQILINLLSNALKYTPVGGQIRIAAGPASLEALNDDFRILPWRDICDLKFVCFTVRDNGIGMTGHTLSHLFTRHFQQGIAGEHTGTDVLAGSHLGLSISKTLTEVQDGTLTVESEPGVGTEAAVYLPEDPVTAEVVARIKSIERCILNQLRRGVFVYALRKYESKQWPGIVGRWLTKPVMNPTERDEEEASFLLWTLGEDVAVAVGTRACDPGLVRGAGEGDWATSAEGYMVGRAFAPAEGSRMTQLINLAFNRMKNASPVLTR